MHDNNGKADQHLRPGFGNIDWEDFSNALREVGFDGFLTIERECGATPEADIRKAVNTLSAIMGK